MLVLVIGTYCEAIGLVLRVVLRNNLHSQGLYIVQYLFVVLSVSAESPRRIALPLALVSSTRRARGS